MSKKSKQTTTKTEDSPPTRPMGPSAILALVEAELQVAASRTIAVLPGASPDNFAVLRPRRSFVPRR